MDVVQPLVRDTQIRLNETGTVQVRNSIDLSPQVSGRVISVNPALASGGRFGAGEVLFRLDDADYRANIERANADLAARQADLEVERAEAEIARREWALVRPNEPIPENVAREPQLARAEAAVRSAEAAIADARLDLSRVTFSLPFEGRILSTTIEVGQNLSAGQSYGRAYDPSSVEVSVPVNSAVLDGLSPAAGRDAIVRTRQLALQQERPSYAARVTREEAELDAQTRLAGLILEFTEAVTLRPGDFVDVEIAGPVIPNAHVFPEGAVQENRTVWVIESGTLAPRRPQFVSAEAGNIVTLPFDVADGIIITTLNNPQEGDPVAIAGQIGTTEARP
ncbi:MAG: efflux RND transporter periplasmic adaptor subunit [Pseudomonadota bacterium]